MSAVAAAASRRRPGDRYLLALAGALAGYALFGKGFGYLGVPPLYVGEIALLAGVVTMLRMGRTLAPFASLSGVVLALAMAWTLARTLPYLSDYGFDAPRDSMIIMYGAFAFIVAALVLDDQRRIDTVVNLYRAFLPWFVPAVTVLFVISFHLRPYLPRHPGTDVPVISIDGGALSVHMAGAVVFAITGFYRARPAWIAAVAAGMVVAGAITRGGLLAFVIPVTIALLAQRRWRSLVTLVVAGGFLLAAAYTFESATGLGAPALGDESERSLSAHQLVKNVASIFGARDPILENSRVWRLRWWQQIIDDTVYGDRFWTGRGFGLNLALAGGYADPRDTEPLRSPHNAHMTILARAGVPGIVLWFGFLAIWAATLASAFVAARRRGEAEWAGLFLWSGCYALALMINASFTVSLEGPMQGIWFWSLIGLGTGACMIYRWQTFGDGRRRA
jgi:hypothetical protein